MLITHVSPEPRAKLVVLYSYSTPCNAYFWRGEEHIYLYHFSVTEFVATHEIYHQSTQMLHITAVPILQHISIIRRTIKYLRERKYGYVIILIILVHVPCNFCYFVL